MEEKANSEDFREYIKLALRLLPSDCLSKFKAYHTPVDETLFSLLCTNQRVLTDLELGAFQFDPVCWLTSSIFTEGWMRSLKHMDIPPEIGSINDLFAYGTIIDQAPNLSSLAIRTPDLVEPFPKDLERINQDDGLLPETLFSRLCMDEPRTLTGIKHLVLEGLVVKSSQQTFERFVDFGRLQQLFLYDCAGSDHLLSRLATSFSVSAPDLIDFRIHFEEVDTRPLERF